MAQILSRAEIAEIMSNDNGSSYRARWPSTKDKELILEAIQSRAKTVKLAAGKFNLRYTQGRTYPVGPAKTEVHSTVYVWPEKGFVPSGWFDEETLKRELLK